MIFVVQRNQTVDLIIARAESAGVVVSPELAGKLADYVELLAKWNRKINLTALPVDPPTDAAIDRLIIEPLVAANLVRQDDRVCVDVGSGGGSPALPLVLARPELQMILVESRTRKAAFLREAIRHLGLRNATVENRRMEVLAERTDLKGAVDLITMRAVRADAALVGTMMQLLRPTGRLFFFGEADYTEFGRLQVIERVELAPGKYLTIIAAM